MRYAMLRAAILSSGFPQWRIGDLAGIAEDRMSRIVCRGVATPRERRALSEVLGMPEHELFAAGPAVDREAVQRLISERERVAQQMDED